MAKLFEGLVAVDKRLLPSAMGKENNTNGKAEDGDNNYVDFENANELNRELLESVNMSGRVYMTHSIVGECM
ncbi:Tyrosine/DOPA decarboxylase 5 [Morella rubra]|uniref:Tyrosine/DOPA decarboxylase 5 n=1 Tax=Morella rubra TaxID=262757 RepID=A0A6A1WBZ1_9ROSI|nr:Tyrosine/DOPA decarboxylase 5 [Morella rubra]